MPARRKRIQNSVDHLTLCKHLREVRLRHNYTQERVASQLSLSRAQYSLLESGYSMINFDQLVTLAAFYNKRLCKFLEGVC